MRLFPYLCLLFLATACGPDDYIITDNTVDNELENITNPLSFSDGLYEIVSRELNIPQEINVPLPDLPRHMSDVNLPDELTPNQQRRALLGRVLFYDTRLSATGETSCATCHQQSSAFADNKALSDGIRGAHTVRNSPALAGVTFARPRQSEAGSVVVGPYSPPQDGETETALLQLFWDGRANSSIAQAVETISNPIEMGMDPEELVAKLNQEPLYQALAQKVHRNRELTVSNVIRDLSDFMLTLPSTNTRFDEYYDLEEAGASPATFAANFSSAELRGAELFVGNCTGCHGSKGRDPIVEFANNGLETDYPDAGRSAVTGDPFDDGVFKTPFIRNVALSAPYMHDGRFATLRDVVDHYSDGVVDHPNLHDRLRNADGSVKRLNLSEEDKAALVAFLEMSRDEVMLNAEYLSDPFIR